MSITIASNCFYTLSLSDRRLSKLVRAQTREQATEMGWIDQLKDWLESGKKKHCLNLMYELHRGHCVLTPEIKAELTRLFAAADPSRLILFWRAELENGESLLGNAMATGDVATINFCHSLLQCFPLSKFYAAQISAMVRYPKKDGIEPLGLALRNNKPEAVRAFLLMVVAALDRSRDANDATGINGVTVREKEAFETVIFSGNVFSDISAVLTTSTMSNQLDGVKQLLAFVGSQRDSSLLWRYTSQIWGMMSSSEGLLLRSTLNNNGQQAIVEGFESLLLLVDITQRQAIVEKVLLKPDDWFSQIYGFESLTDEDMHQRFDTFDRYAALLRHLGLFVPQSTWQYNESNTSQYFDRFIRSALKLRRNDTVTLLLELDGSAYGDPWLPAIVSKLAHDLLRESDLDGFLALLKSKNTDAITAVLRVLNADESERDRLWNHSVSTKNWGSIDNLLAYSGAWPALATLIRGLLDAISRDDAVLVRVMRSRLLTAERPYADISQLWESTSPAQKILLTNSIAREEMLIEKLFQNAPKAAALGQIFFEIIKAAPEDSLEQIFKIILRNSSTLPTDFYFNHLDSPGGSLLTIVSQLNVDDGLKKCLMGMIAQAMNGLTVQQKNNLAKSARDIWLNDNGYLDNKEVLTFVKFILPLTVIDGNLGRLVASGRYLALLVDYVQDCVQKENNSHPKRTGEFMLNNNGFFVQLMVLCTMHKELELRQAAEALYDQYLSLDALKPHAQFLADYCFLADGIRSSSSSEEIALEADPADRAQKNPVKKTDRVYIFVCPKPGQGPDGKLWTGVLLHQEDIENMLGLQDVEWPGDTFTEAVDIEGRREIAEKLLGSNVTKTYLQFPVFAKRYAEIEATFLLKKLFQLLDLRHATITPQGAVSIDYTAYFLEALAVNKMTGPKFTGIEDQERLMEIFGKYLIMPHGDPETLEQVPTVQSEHLKRIYALYGLTTEPEMAQDKVNAAQTLFCLATLFCRFSSSSMFGEGGDSPRAIRYYAGALLKQAVELAPDVIKTSDYLGFMNALYGLTQNVETCTYVLSLSMAVYIRAQHSPQFSSCFSRMKPAAWQLA